MTKPKQLRELVHAAYHEGYRAGALRGGDELGARIHSWNCSDARATLAGAISAISTERAIVRHPQTTIPCPVCHGDPDPCVDGWDETPGVCDVCGTSGEISLADVPGIVGALLDRLDARDRTVNQLLGRIERMEKEKC